MVSRFRTLLIGLVSILIWRLATFDPLGRSTTVVTETARPWMDSEPPLPSQNRPTVDNEDEPLPPVVFYNFFMGDSSTSQANAARIAEEQLLQVQSALVSSDVRYVTIGHSKAAFAVADTCARLDGLECRHVAHYTNGTEARTLSAMRNFCQTASDGQRVVYLHNKGSFHYSGSNENWRPMLTAAALSHHCLSAVPSQCNVCALQFHTMWTTMAAGNMFAADCGYVRQLIDPADLPALLEKAAGHAMNLFLQGRLDMALMKEARIDRFGLGRYADEFWIGSHPDVRPCHVDTCGWLGDCYHARRASQDSLQLHVGPQDGPPGYATAFFERIDDILDDPHKSRREYYLLPGLLLKWMTINGKGPEPDSWVWKYFPDGLFWKDQIAKHGVEAVDKATELYVSDVMKQQPTLFSTSPLELQVDQGNEAIFYEIKMENSSPGVVALQLDLVKRNAPQSTVYINDLSAQKTPHIDDLCVESGLRCRDIGAKRGYQGDTLQALYTYCQSSPSSRVSYIHNILPRELQYLGDNFGTQSLLGHVTAAALSPDCRLSTHCSTCGLLFTTIAMPSYDGNMWTAGCSYVNKLLAPNEFVLRMQDVVERVLVDALKKVLSMAILPARPDTLGVGGYALEHWIGSHPGIVPCNLSPSYNLKTWMRGLTRKPDYELTIGPRPIAGGRVAYVQGKPEKRLREFLFLPGQILKWTMLYDQLPPQDSWVWEWYPDGERWKLAVAEHGPVLAIYNVTFEHTKKALGVL